MHRLAFWAAGLAIFTGCGQRTGDSAPAPEPVVANGVPPELDVTGQLATAPRLQPKARFKLPDRTVFQECMQLSTDGKRLAVAHVAPKELTPQVIQVWDLSATPKLIAEFPGGFFALSPSGRRIVPASGRVVYDVDTKQPVARLPDNFQSGFFRDDSTLVSIWGGLGSQEPKGTIHVWDVAKDKEIKSISVSDRRYLCARATKGGKEIWLFLSTDTFAVDCYDLDTGRLVRTLKPVPTDAARPFTSAGTEQTVTTDGSVFGARVGDNDIRMRFYDGESGNSVGQLPPGLDSTLSGFLPGRSRYVAAVMTPDRLGLGPKAFVLFDWNAKQVLAVLSGHTNNNAHVIGSADGKVTLSATENGDILVYDTSVLK